MAEEDIFGNLQIEVAGFPDYGHAFYHDQPFVSREELVNYVKMVGKEQGFVLKISRSDSGKRERVILTCERAGVFVPDKRSKGKNITGSKKSNCPFSIYAKPTVKGGPWELQVKCGKHNHLPFDSLLGHGNAGSLKPEEKDFVQELTKSGVKANRTMITLKERHPDNASTIRHIYNARKRYRLNVRLPRTEMQHLLKLLSDEGYDTWHTTFEGNVVENMFFAHPTSIQLLRNFNIVLCIDSTYKTNRYKMPLIEVVGLTSTWKTFTIAFCFTSDEKKETYVWALEKVRNLIQRTSDYPKVIVTDMDGALVGAVETVFPDAAHLLCQYHIKCNVRGRCKEYYEDLDKEAIVMEGFENIVHCRFKENYQDCVDIFVQRCGDESGEFVNYVKDTYLNRKERFVDAWIDQHMHIGNTTTNRVESAHSSFKRMLADNKGDIATCFECMQRLVTTQHIAILASFEESKMRVEHRVINPLFKDLLYNISREGLSIIYNQAKCLSISDEHVCDCKIRTTHGLPCRCEIAKYKKLGQPIPLGSVHSFWQSLSMDVKIKAEDTEGENGNCGLTPNRQRLWEEFNNMYNESNSDVKKRLIDKFREVVKPDTTTLQPPKVPVSTKGRKSAKTANDTSTKRDPSYFEHMEKQLNDSLTEQLREGSQPSQSSHVSQKRSSKKSKKKAEKNCQPSLSQSRKRTRNSHGFEPHVIWEPYIDYVHDVVGDGNCGFRAISLHRFGKEDNHNLIRLDLINEMKDHRDLYISLLGGIKEYESRLESLHAPAGSVGMDKWLLLPDMGDIIASRYNVVFVSIPSQTIGECITFLPHNTAPGANIRVWAVGRSVLKNHFVQVKLCDGSPLPPVYQLWRTHFSGGAGAWEAVIADRLLAYRPFLPKPMPPSEVETVVLD